MKDQPPKISATTISIKGVEFIKRWEGFRSKAYQCDAGVWTIGYGTTFINGKPVVKGMEITKIQANEYFANDVTEREDIVRRRVSVPLTQNQFDVLVSFCYNFDERRFKESTLLYLLNQGHYSQVPTQLKKWVHVKGLPNKGLINRRNSEIAVWNDSDYSK